MPTLKTFIYVDGFNLYYRALKHTPYKWLNIKELCALALGQRYQVDRIEYYTARVSDKIDPDQPRRQQVYLRALRTVPEVQIYYGKFLVHPVRLPLQTPLPDGTRSVWVMRTEEKGSDVNLASHLVHDAHKGAFEAAAVVSCDTDLVEPVRSSRKRLGSLSACCRHRSKARNRLRLWLPKSEGLGKLASSRPSSRMRRDPQAWELVVRAGPRVRRARTPTGAEF
jgi:hypothetical protein